MGMARHYAIEEHTATGTEARTRSTSDDDTQSALEAQRTLIRERFLGGDAASAVAAARQLASQTGRHDGIDMLLDLALEHGRGQLARTVLAEAEAMLSAVQIAQIKARIVMTEGDLQAAKAILVMAIEAHPDSVSLRALLAETMVAGGTAADARAVLSNLGLAPVNPACADGASVEDTYPDHDEPEKKIV